MFFIFFFNGPLIVTIIRPIILDRSSPNFQDRHVYMGGHDKSDLLCRDRLGVIAMVTDFWWRESTKIGTLYLHSVRWHSTTDGRIATRHGCAR